MKKIHITTLLSASFIVIPMVQGAQYRVVELPLASLAGNSFPSAINAAGTISVNLQNQYNPTIDFTLLDFDSEPLLSYLTDIESAKGWDLNDSDYTYVYSYIMANSGNQTFQQIATYNGYLADESSSELLHGFDTIDNTSGEYRNSATLMVRGLNDFGNAVGLSQDGFYTLSYVTNDVVDVTYVLNDFYSRGFALIEGKTVGLLPPDTTAGGLSDAYDINASNQVVGVATTEMVSSSFQTSVEACSDPEQRGDIPEASCLRSLSVELNNNVGSIAQRRGIIWQLDEKGNTTETLQLGMLISPDSTDSSIYSSSAVAINDYGVAVGASPAFYADTGSLTTAAAFYFNDEVLTINPDDENFSSVATDVNNDNVAVGYATKSISGLTKTKFFVHDINTDLTSFPEDFFASSGSVANSINNQGMVVGYGESEAVSGTRRTEGFLYDYRNNLFVGLNSLLECNSPYTISQANAINDDNEIAATALVTGPARDITGGIILDDLGAETDVDYVVAVKLVPISGGSIDNCDAYEEEVVRQGASFTWLAFLGLFVVVLRFRQQVNKPITNCT
ncbi:DUF3466 family protein [Flavobacterium sp. W21_SRS_FM6]|uniref:DUF3466 family protein n=1 Tax=Flavobacterium sp. W21_SRS_FM6 TaxID=3240268 RepID=UPI003F931A92